MRKFISFLFILFLAGVIFNSLSFAIAEDLTKKHSGGNVDVTVTLTDVEDLTSIRDKKELKFRVYLNTHSVDLLAYQMDKISFLRDEKGNEYKAESWKTLSESSHHRSGIIKFSNLDGKGDFIITSSSKSIELVIKELAGIKERVFRWDLPGRTAEAKELEKGNFTIEWLGHSSFLITSKEDIREVKK
ncbi:MAG TPA: hypothetical protein ENH97_02200 [bacterium]|nr:hypothetical protein [bacterium]